MRRLAIVGLTLALSACSSEPANGERPLEATTWSATDIYLSPDAPSALPAASAGAVTLVFGHASATGNTGCAPLQATTTLDGDHLTFDEVNYGEASPTCPELALGVHELVTGLIHDGSAFSVDRRGPAEIVLTAETEAVDSPSIRLLGL